MLFGAKEFQDTSNIAHEKTVKPKHLASQAIAEPKTSELLSSKKRKVSVPDLTLGQMTTVYEGLLDSRKLVPGIGSSAFYMLILPSNITSSSPVSGKISELP